MGANVFNLRTLFGFPIALYIPHAGAGAIDVAVVYRSLGLEFVFGNTLELGPPILHYMCSILELDFFTLPGAHQTHIDTLFCCMLYVVCCKCYSWCCSLPH